MTYAANVTFFFFFFLPVYLKHREKRHKVLVKLSEKNGH